MTNFFSLLNKKSATCRIVLLLVLAGFAASCQSHTEGLVQSEKRAEETVAIGNLRAISSAQRAYSMSNEGDFGTFAQLVEAGFLDTRFEKSEPELNGYAFKMEVGEKQFSCHADPAETTEPAGRHYYVDSSTSLIRMNPVRPATAEDPPFQP